MSKKSPCVAMLLVVSLAVGSVWADLELYYSFDEGTGTTATDLSGNGRDGTLEGDPTWIDGAVGGALEFDGTGDYVNVTDYPGINSVGGSQLPFSITNWFYTTIATGNHEMVTWGTNTGRQRLTWRVHEGRLRTEHGSGNLRGNTYCNDGEWHFGALTVEEGANLRPDVTKLYLDGIEDTTFSGSDNPYELQANADVSIGRSGPQNARYWIGGIDDVAIYSHTLTPDEVMDIMENTPLPFRTKASRPSPSTGTVDLVYYADTLSWTGGDGAVKRDVYFGTSFDDVNAATVADPRGALASEGLTETTLAMPVDLELETTYYWRVDEVNSPPDSTLFPGDVWSFTVEDVALRVENVGASASSQSDPNQVAVKTVDGSGLNAAGEHLSNMDDMWLNAMTEVAGAWIQYDLKKAYALHRMHVWNHNSQSEAFLGYGVKDAVVEISTDGENWTEFKTVELPQAPGTDGYTGSDVALDEVVAQYVRIKPLSNYSLLGLTQVGLSEVRFYEVPVAARDFSPPSGTDTDDTSVTLSWRAGRYTVEHRVLHSTDLGAIKDGSAVIATTADKSVDVADLEYSQLNYWQVIDVTADGSEYPSDIMSFYTAPVGMIDDMERYQAEEGLFIWEHWIDGFEDDTNGSVVGNGNDAEKTVVFESSQSLPMTYDNTVAAMSEATRYFDTAVDLTDGNPEALKLQVHGDQPGFIITEDTITLGASGRDLWNADDEGRFVYKTLTGDGSITAKVESLANVHAWAKGGVMIRENNAAESSDAYVVTSAASGLTFQHRLETFTNATSDTGTRSDFWTNHNEKPVWVRVERVGNEFNGYISVDGENWEASANNPQTITMIPSVKMGLCATSHDNTVSTVAVFSNITTTGHVSGNWERVEWGGGTSGHPNNDPAPLYLRLADTAGKEQTFEHPNPEVTVVTAWDEWTIPITDLTGINAAKLDSITIGVSGAGVNGRIYVDAIRVDRPAAAAPPAEVSDADLIAHYEFEGDTQDSAGENHGERFDNASLTVDGTLALDILPDVNDVNVGGYMAIANLHYETTGLEEVSVCAWIRTEREEDAIIVSFDRNEYYRFQINGEGGGPGQIGWSVMTSEGQVDYGSVDRVDDGDWHHVAGTFGKGVLRIYIDGVPQPAATGGSTFGSGNRRFGYVGIGSESAEYNLEPRTPAAYVLGEVDDVRIYHRALLPGEITTLATP